jgi:methionyl-tRNA synthetase
MSPHFQTPFALTTPLYYVNALPHIGSAYTTMAADAIARFQRLQGREVLLITGTDEHGQKIQRTAAQRQLPPQTHCDEIAAGFQTLWQQLNIQYDRFSRTTAPRHRFIVKEFFQRVWDKGDIYLSQQQGWYCVECEEFKEERDLLPDKLCPIHTNRTVEWRDEQNYFFKLSRYQTDLEEYYCKNPHFIQPESRRNEVLNFVQSGLQDFSISRINLEWGIPLPENPQHTLYVWFDALLGYITALLEPEEEPTLANALKHWWPIQLHLIGKDILRFHAVYWPAMLLSAELPLPPRVFGHGFLTKDGQKMGKSLGNTLDPIELVQEYGTDAVRYYFLKGIEFGKDGDFTLTRFADLLNADLADTLGNLLNRTAKMAVKYCGGCVPTLDIQGISSEIAVVAAAQSIGQQVLTAYESLSFSQACEAAVQLARMGNKFIDEQAPWSLYKQGDGAGVHQTLYVALEIVRLVAYLIVPITPTLSTKIYQQLGYDLDFNQQASASQRTPYTIHSQWGTLPPGQVLTAPEPVFQKIQLLTAEVL